MSNEKEQEKKQYETYKPEHPADKKTIQKDQQEIRDAAKHAAQQIAGEELKEEGVEPVSRKEAEKELREAVKKVQEEKKHS